MILISKHKRWRRSLGVHLERTESLNTDPLYMETLSDVVYKKWQEVSEFINEYKSASLS